MIRTSRSAAAARLTRPAAPVRLLAAVLLGAAVAAAPLAVPAAEAAGSVTITLPGGASAANPAEATSITVAGRGFQSVSGGFGGVYVLFGWVSGEGWAPSRGGQAGADYRYVPDSQSKDNAGYERFVAFPGGETESAANGVLAADGSFSVDLTIPSARFEATDRSGALTTVDCLEVQCGVITLGAHGVKNANNESFTPLSFAAPSAGAAAPAAADPSAGAPGAAVPGSEEPTAAAGTARVGYTASSAVAGNALSFTGQGFAVSEQVVATLDDGVVAVGPLTAGTRGEVAGVLPLPADLRGGTHLLTLTGAASGASAQSEVTVVAAAAPGAPSAPPAQEVPVWLSLALGAALLIAAGLVLASVVAAIVRAARRRRVRRGAEAQGAAPGADPAPATATPLLGRETADVR
ncbi:hypothetical protein [Rathayibacter sp. VKM Ac-2801]|uniref:hypothetical protein n=1 Tax=Rathayibacter sp. VKM Ac-2801 TaxID=2609255 RepID=UPI0013201896|nr:hypothetical protein [Rathayibacter sp. VKM Ac-2801]QHC69170.1 hypothetical protein GSU45_01405 [Rathayibacter sp. VKM Ac-2801]